MSRDHTLREIFISRFGEGEQIVIGAAPGRVNLIGEHTDYNEGFVLPMAIDFTVQLAARLRSDQTVRIYSADYDKEVSFSLERPIEYDHQNRWSNYLRGVLWALQESGFNLSGMEMAFSGNLPQGAGLSSSAAIEVATAVVTQSLIGFMIEPPRLALLCQRAENEFVGMKCGIMDQFISLMGKKDRALFLDCRTLEYQHIPLDLGKYQILICHSGVKHALVDSEYNARREECQIGLGVLQKHFNGIEALRDAKLEEAEFCKEEMGPKIFRRCRHVITENERVLASVEALQKGDLERFGRLMNASHDSQRDDYEVSCPEVDLLVDLARKTPGTLGARITGGGFGGCTINLVAGRALHDFTEGVLEEYQRLTKIEPHLYISAPAEGGRIIFPPLR